MKTRFRYVEDVESIMFDKYNAFYHTVLDDYTAMLKPYTKNGIVDFNKLEMDMFYNPSFSGRLGRSQALMEKLDKLTSNLAKTELQLMDRTLINIYKANYYEMFYEVQKGLGYELAFAHLEPKRLSQVIHTAWAKDGREFSDRIWRDKTLLRTKLRTLIEESITTGQNPRTTAYLLRNATSNSYYNAQRILRTETTAIIAESDKASFTELGFTEYRYNATFDSRTSERCGQMDDRKFNFSAMQVGLNAPPLHPNCRSTIEPVDILDWKPPYKYGRDGFGKPMKIDGNMTFEQFKKKYKL